MRLELTVAREAGSLNRVLGVVLRRGFETVSLAVVPAGEGEFRVELEVAGARPVELLARQLAGLFDVRRVEVRR